MNPMRIFWFIICFFSFLFFSFLFVWKFDVLFVGLLVVVFLMVTINRRGRYYYYICIIVHGVQSVTLIIGFIHSHRIFFTLWTAEVKVSFRPIH